MKPSEAIENIEYARRWMGCESDFFDEALDMAIFALKKLEQTCDTCKHGYFGDTWCERCAVRFASHYEAEAEEES